MTSQKVKDQEVTQEEGFNEADANTSCDETSCDNMADAEQSSADTMADEESNNDNSVQEPTPEEVIAVWRDKYMRLQAEFDIPRGGRCRLFSWYRER